MPDSAGTHPRRTRLLLILLLASVALLIVTRFVIPEPPNVRYEPLPNLPKKPHVCEQQGFAASNVTRPYDRVVLVTIDTLRADHLKAYGYARDTMPFFDSLATRGAVFDQARSACSHTAPSHTSMLTGRLPADHGVTLNGKHLDPKTQHVACMFRAQGFDTAAFTSVGFLFPITLAFDKRDAKVRMGEDTVDAALAWVKSLRPDAPFFLWVHLFDPHEWAVPFPGEADYLKTVRSSSDLQGEDFTAYLRKLHAMPDPERAAASILEHGHKEATSPEEAASLVAGLLDAYDARIRYTDDQLKRLYDGIETARTGGALWIVTADHGEGLGSHDYAGHGVELYQEQLHVPLLVLDTTGARLHGGRRLDVLVSLMDLYPTLLDLFGQPAPETAPSRSMLPWLTNEAAPKGTRFVLAQRRDWATWTENAGMVAERMFAIEADRRKYILRTVRGDLAFDLAEDPNEANDLRAADPGYGEDLRRQLETQIQDYGVDLERAVEAEADDGAGIDQNTMRELKALGYAQ